MRSQLELAQHLYDLGFSIIPIGLRSKRPVVKWKKYQSRRCSVGDLREWFHSGRCRPGIVTGAISGIVAVDLDNIDAVREWFHSETRDLPVTQQTTRGLHVIYRHVGPHTANRVGLGGRAIDVRGDGGYILAREGSMGWTPELLASSPVYRDASGPVAPLGVVPLDEAPPAEYDEQEHEIHWLF